MGEPSVSPSLSTIRLARREITVYLNDHLSAAVAGAELARRAAKAARGQPHAERLSVLAAEIEEDHRALRRVMDELRVPPSRYKASLARAAEKAGRLKLNGRLVRRAPLSSVVELEALLVGVEGKAALWETLSALAEQDSRLDRRGPAELLARARHQAAELRRLHDEVVLRVFAPGTERRSAVLAPGP
jgi:hypothetical protein